MRVSDDRYTRDRERLDLALRLIRHEARTYTIRQWTGLSDDRIRKLYRSYCTDLQSAEVLRHRGKSPRQAAYALKRLKLLAERMGVWEDDDFRQRFTRLRLDLEDHKDLYETFVEKVRRREALGPDVSMLKVHQTELFQRITETMLDIAGEYGAGMGPLEGNQELNPTGLFLQSRPSSIYAGSNEIQRNILARNVLELPG